MSVSPQQAKMLLDANTVNLANKVTAGKILSAGEVTMLQSVAAGAAPTEVVTERYVPGQQELAKALGLKDRKTIQRWLKLPGNPGRKDDGRYDVIAWREFARSKGHEFGESSDLASARAQQLLLQNEKLRDAILRNRKELIPKVLAQQVFSKLLLSAKAQCFTGITRFVMLARMSPDTATASEEVRKEMANIWKTLEDSKWLR